MEDKNKNSIPDWIDTLIGYAVTVAGAVGAYYATTPNPPRWAIIMVSVAAVCGGIFKSGITSMPGTGKSPS